MRAKMMLLSGALALALSACTAPTSTDPQDNGDRYGSGNSSIWAGNDDLEVDEEKPETTEEEPEVDDDGIIVLPPKPSEEPATPITETLPERVSQNSGAETKFLLAFNELRESYGLDGFRREGELDALALESSSASMKEQKLYSVLNLEDEMEEANYSKFTEILIGTGGPDVSESLVTILLHNDSYRKKINYPYYEKIGLSIQCTTPTSCVMSLILATKDKIEPEPGDPDYVEQETWDGTIDEQYKDCEEVMVHNLGPYKEGVDPEYFWYQDVNADGVVCDGGDVVEDEVDEEGGSPEGADDASQTSEPPAGVDEASQTNAP